MSKWRWILQQLSGRLWLRASVFCLIGVASALISLAFKDFLPTDLTYKIGADAVDDILNIIATSMLAATTFSLGVMVSAYTAATSNATPRATKLLLADSTAQYALSTFIGAFLFSLVGIVALKTGVYGEGGRLLLFTVTIAVILFVILTLLRWIEHLSRLGQVSQMINMVEDAATRSLQGYIDYPYIGGVPLDNFIPDDRHACVQAPAIGYVQHIDMQNLSDIAQEHDLLVYINARPGKFNNSYEPLAYVAGKVDEAVLARFARAFTIGDDRSFDYDPRYGLIVLSEIASRALSPGVNDPGTAIDVIGTLVRVLSPLVATKHEEEKEITYPKIYVPGLNYADMFDDCFMPIARDGAGTREVVIRLQKAYHVLYNLGDEKARQEARRLSYYTHSHASAKLPLPDDVASIEALLIR